MAYDTELEARIDLASLNWPGMGKKAMFGGMGYLLRGNMAFGIWRDRLVIRCGPERYAACLALPHVGPFDVTGKAMTGWIVVAAPAFDSDTTLNDWLMLGRDFAASLPGK